MEAEIKKMEYLRQFEIKLLIRLDKEFSDAFYVPVSSMTDALDILCKRPRDKSDPNYATDYSNV